MWRAQIDIQRVARCGVLVHGWGVLEAWSWLGAWCGVLGIAVRQVVNACAVDVSFCRLLCIEGHQWWALVLGSCQQLTRAISASCGCSTAGCCLWLPCVPCCRQQRGARADLVGFIVASDAHVGSACGSHAGVASVGA